MKNRITVRGCLVALGVAIFILLAYGGVNFHVNGRIAAKVSSAVCDLSDFKKAFWLFREKHRCWPHAIEDIYGLKTHEGVVAELGNRDPLSGLPYSCVTDKNLYYRLHDGEPQKILVMLPMPFKTKAWPFGEVRTIVATPLGVSIVSCDEIIDMNQK